MVVGVLPLPPEDNFEPLPERELEVIFQAKGGPGGQHRNKTASACRMKHVPTGLSVFIDGRDQHANRREALRILTARVHRLRNGDAQADYAAMKGDRFASRGRGSKIRTYNLIEGRVTDHRTGRETRDVKGVMKGKLELIR